MGRPSCTGSLCCRRERRAPRAWTFHVKITGERPVDGVTPDGLVALHTAGYLEVASRLGPGRVLDIGCGVGFGGSLLEADARDVYAVDYDLDAARMASGRNGASLLAFCGDGGALGLGSRQFDWVCSSHIIEHFHEPENHIREMARVLKAGGTAFVLTPNPPADLENPYHVHLFTPEELRSSLERYFEDVWIGGHDGTATVKADFAARRAAAQRLLRLDFLKLRHRVPHSWYVACYGAATRLFYRLQAGRHAGGTTKITAADFSTTEQVDATTLNLFAMASRPRMAAVAP